MIEKSRLRSVVQAEFARHRWDTFVDEPPGNHLAAKVWEAVEREYDSVYRQGGFWSGQR